MKISEQCLPCLISQVIKVANIIDAHDRDELYRRVFSYMGALDFSARSPQVVGDTFRMLKEHTGNPDPYKALRRHYTEMFMKKAAELITKTSLPIGDIINSVGYENESYFHREFKRRTGKTPLSMRKNSKNEAK